MDIETLKQQAYKAWFEYGEVIKEAFGFEGNIIAELPSRVIDTNDEEHITGFIAHVKEQTQNLRKMRRNNTS